MDNALFGKYFGNLSANGVHTSGAEDANPISVLNGIL